MVKHKSTSYAALWSLSVSDRKKFVLKIRDYLETKIVNNLPMHPPKSEPGKKPGATFKKSGGGYAYAIYLLHTVKHNTCIMHPDAKSLLNTNNIVINVDNDNRIKHDPFRVACYALNTFGNHRGLNRQLQNCIDTHETNKNPKYLVHEIDLIFFKNDKFMLSHATLIVFDMVHKYQIHFDPRCDKHDTNTILSLPLIPGYKTVPVKECAFEKNRSVQTYFESDNYRGLCGIMCYIVMVLCNRFDYFHPKNMSQMLMDAYPDKKDRESLIGRFISFFHLPDAERLKRVYSPGETCMSFVQSTHKLCEERSCASLLKGKILRPDGLYAYCPFHKNDSVDGHPPKKNIGMSPCNSPVRKRDWSWRGKGEID
jgi:hypothetical protein